MYTLCILKKIHESISPRTAWKLKSCEILAPSFFFQINQYQKITFNINEKLNTQFRQHFDKNFIF